ncbi:hypothetical protein AGMMS50293_01000 [Spirochaetia bacterium]|nr:hypothetical protein AGMMS50293_01000 [Spirochaetia bacterium]
MDEMLDSGAVSFAVAAQWVLPAAGLVPADATEDAAFNAAQQGKMVPAAAAAEQAIRLDEFSFLLAKAFKLKGGLLYTWFPGPRYAYRELRYRKLLDGRIDPAQKVPGQRLLHILSQVLDYYGEIEKQRIAAELKALIAKEFGDSATAPHVAVVEEGVSISLKNLGFRADDSTFTAEEKVELQKIARILETLPRKPLLVAGHTALAGSAAGRLSVSQSRAQTLANYLIELGTRRRDEITIRGYGAERPIADNTTLEGMALNRRVEIIILE